VNSSSPYGHTSSPDFFLRKYGANAGLNRMDEADWAAHRWYRFVLSYPPHLVRDYLRTFAAAPGQTVLDPFCGTGTTLVEVKKHGITAVGLESHPLVHFVAAVKLDWTSDGPALLAHARGIATKARAVLAAGGSLRVLDAAQMELLLKNSISPLPLHKTLVLLDAIEDARDDLAFYDKERLALAQATVFATSNLHFGPEVGVKGFKEDADVIGLWLVEIEHMAEDLALLNAGAGVPARAICADAREIGNLLAPASVDFVICSPPYPNEKDYSRTTRLETVLLGYASTKEELRAIKQGLLRSNTRGVYKLDEDDLYVADNARIQEVARTIEARRIELGKTSGFERLYARVTLLYFGGMARHFSELRPLLKPGARLAYVVGDQASYLRVMIRTGQILGEVATSLGYEVESLDLFRTRISTATKEQLREEVLVLRWPG
jgi:hypothetical protein